MTERLSKDDQAVLETLSNEDKAEFEAFAAIESRLDAENRSCDAAAEAVKEFFASTEDLVAFLKERPHLFYVDRGLVQSVPIGERQTWMRLYRKLFEGGAMDVDAVKEWLKTMPRWHCHQAAGFMRQKISNSVLQFEELDDAGTSVALLCDRKRRVVVDLTASARARPILLTHDLYFKYGEHTAEGGGRGKESDRYMGYFYAAPGILAESKMPSYHKAIILSGPMEGNTVYVLSTEVYDMKAISNTNLLPIGCKAAFIFYRTSRTSLNTRAVHMVPFREDDGDPFLAEGAGTVLMPENRVKQTSNGKKGDAEREEVPRTFAVHLRSADGFLVCHARRIEVMDSIINSYAQRDGWLNLKMLEQYFNEHKKNSATTTPFMGEDSSAEEFIRGLPHLYEVATNEIGETTSSFIVRKRPNREEITALVEGIGRSTTMQRGDLIQKIKDAILQLEAVKNGSTKADDVLSAIKALLPRDKGPTSRINAVKLHNGLLVPRNGRA